MSLGPLEYVTAARVSAMRRHGAGVQLYVEDVAGNEVTVRLTRRQAADLCDLLISAVAGPAHPYTDKAGLAWATAGWAHEQRAG